MSGFKQTFGYFAVFSVVLTTIIFYHILNFPQQYMGDKSLENQTKSKVSHGSEYCLCVSILLLFSLLVLFIYSEGTAN